MKETVRIEECCEGYETRDIFKYGCPIGELFQNRWRSSEEVSLDH